MAEVRAVGEIGAGVDEVWTLVGDFGGFIAAMGLPVTVEGSGVGQTRTITTGAVPTIERLEGLDAEARTIVYSIVSGDLPVSGYVSTMELTSLGDGRTRLTWTSIFQPVGAEADAIAFIERIYRAGIKGLQARYGG